MLQLDSVPQALQTGYASRLRLGQTSFFVSTVADVRGPHSKRGSAAAAWGEFADLEDDDEDDDPSFGRSPPSRASLSKPGQARTEVKKLAQPTRHAVYTEEHLQQLAEDDEVLVPVRLSLDVEHYRVTDFLLWNANEPVLTPEQFAIVTCQDLDLPVGYTSNIASAIKTQLAEYGELAAMKLPQDLGVRVIVNLSVNLDKELYEDRFEWDLAGSTITPHLFARQVAADLSLEAEFVPAIAHAITESLLRFKREYVEDRLPPTPDNLVAPGKLERIRAEAGLRYDPEGLGDEWVPTTDTLSQSELERREMERERMIRRMKRESARAGDLDMASMFGRKRRRRESPRPW